MYLLLVSLVIGTVFFDEACSRVPLKPSNGGGNIRGKRDVSGGRSPGNNHQVTITR